MNAWSIFSIEISADSQIVQQGMEGRPSRSKEMKRMKTLFPIMSSKLIIEIIEVNCALQKKKFNIFPKYIYVLKLRPNQNLSWVTTPRNAVLMCSSEKNT